MATITFDPELELAAKQLSERTGEPVIDAVRVAVRERLDRVGTPAGASKFKSAEEMMVFVRSFNLKNRHPELSDDQIVGYNEQGHFD